ncbi:MAG: hypothetical protein JJE28_03020 [Actinomycetales bacterium]|nr:hypothetical protein [Actinomycetales bacterium]
MNEQGAWDVLAAMKDPAVAEVVRAAVKLQTEGWCSWLATIGYGIDFGAECEPPCLAEDLAAAYMDKPANRDDGMSLDDWVWCIQENTGAFVEPGATS